MTTTPKIDAAISEARKRAFTAYEEKDALGMLAAETEVRLLDRKRDFVRYATRLAESLLAAAARVEDAPEYHFSVNSLGEALNNSNALDADRACIEIGALRQMLADIAAARKAAAKKEGGRC